MVPLLIVIGLLALSALFSSSELAIMGVPLYKIKRYIREHPEREARSKLLFKLRTNGERTLIAILIGNNLVNVALSIYAARLGDTVLANFALAGAYSFILISVTITFLILFFGEIIPKVFATKYSLTYGIAVAPVVQFVIWMLFPFVYILELIIHGLNNILGADEDGVSKEDVEIFVEEGEKQGIFSKTEALIIHNFLEFDSRAVESVFKHRTEVYALDESCTLGEAVTKMLHKPFSRVPIYRNDKDHIVGLLTLRDALRLYVDEKNHERKIKEFGFKNIAKVPITASVFDVFLDMKKQGWHFAVVIDEYGGTAGIVTFEDILEDLVGAIRDESDHWEEGEIVKENSHTLEIKGDVILRDVIDILQLTAFRIPEEHADDISEEDTVSYIILHILKDFAKKGDIISFGDLNFEVARTNRDGDKIERIKVVYGNIPESQE